MQTFTLYIKVADLAADPQREIANIMREAANLIETSPPPVKGHMVHRLTQDRLAEWSLDAATASGKAA